MIYALHLLLIQRTKHNLEPDKTIYPVIVYIHSGDFSSGTAQSQPGHVLAIQDVVVVTFNYRLGALGKSK
jgi:carboxylesterase type B